VSAPAVAPATDAERAAFLRLARGHRQQQFLAELYAGYAVLDPAFWDGTRARLAKPNRRWAYRKLREAIVVRGYALHTTTPDPTRPWMHAYRLLRGEVPR